MTKKERQVIIDHMNTDAIWTAKFRADGNEENMRRHSNNVLRSDILQRRSEWTSLTKSSKPTTRFTASMSITNTGRCKGMKVKTKAVYKDDTHRKMVRHYNSLKDLYKRWIEEDDKTMIDYTYDKLITISETLFYCGAITIERKLYLDKELDKMRGWDF